MSDESNVTPAQAAAVLGRIGGSRNTPAQLAARARNAKRGGWPKGRKRGPRKPPTTPVSSTTQTSSMPERSNADK